jgi:DNA-binding NarL/FixJ family response regulator
VNLTLPLTGSSNVARADEAQPPVTISTRAPTTVTVARFEDIIAVGLQSLIESDPNLALIAAGVDLGDMAQTLERHRPDVAILNFGSLQSPAVIRELAGCFPDTRLLVLANNPSAAECRQLIGFGATACLAKSTEARDVLHAIYLASRGLNVLPSGTDTDAGDPTSAGTGPVPLTARETDVFELLQRGVSNGEIAAELGVGVETIRTHARHIYRKLGVSTRRELRPLA